MGGDDPPGVRSRPPRVSSLRGRNARDRLHHPTRRDQAPLGSSPKAREGRSPASARPAAARLPCVRSASSRLSRRKREAGGVGSRPMGTPPHGVRRSPLPTGRAPGGRPAVETPPRRPGEPPGGSPRDTPHWKAEKQSPIIERSWTWYSTPASTAHFGHFSLRLDPGACHPAGAFAGMTVVGFLPMVR